MPLIEADSLKQISISKIIELSKPSNPTPYIIQQLNFSRNGQDVGTMGLITYFDNLRPVKINLDYVMVYGGEKRNQDINIVAMPCHFGGVRYFFKCPDCDCRCFKIYMARTHFKCRKCHNLTYTSNNASKGYRKFSKLFEPLVFYDSSTYHKALKYPKHKGRYTRNYIKAMHKLANINV